MGMKLKLSVLCTHFLVCADNFFFASQVLILLLCENGRAATSCKMIDARRPQIVLDGADKKMDAAK